MKNNPIIRIDPTGAFPCEPGDPFCPNPCSPFDPFCTGCGPEDPSCNGCDPENPFCGKPPIGPVPDPFGNGGGGGGNPENTRPFPWPQLPLGFFQPLNSVGTGKGLICECNLDAGLIRGIGCLYSCPVCWPPLNFEVYAFHCPLGSKKFPYLCPPVVITKDGHAIWPSDLNGLCN